MVANARDFRSGKKKLRIFLPTVYLLLYFFLHFSFSFTNSLLFFYLLPIFCQAFSWGGVTNFDLVV